MLTRQWLLGLAIGVALLAAGPAGAGGTLVRGHGAAWETLDPQLCSGVRDSMIVNDLYEGLVTAAADGTPAPGAAERWEISPDGLIYTFHLRAGLAWSNGDPLTAQDFVAGMLRLIDPATASAKAYYLTASLKVHNAAPFNAGTLKDASQVGFAAPDDRTVRITLDLPAPHALDLLNSYETAPIHAPSLARFGKDFTRPGNLVSNGPFMLQELVPQSHLLLVRNPHYWDAKEVSLDSVRYEVTEDVNTELKRYQAGELDVTSQFPADQMEALRRDLPPGEVRVVPDLSSYYLSFNLNRPPLSDIRLRRALSMVIDRETLQDKILKTGAPAIYSYVPPVDPAYHGPVVAERDLSREQRLAEARRLYAEAGYGPDKPLKVSIYSTNDEQEKKKALAISIMWKTALGVETELVNQEYQAWAAALPTGGWDVFNDNVVGDYAGAETFLNYMRPSADPGYHWKNSSYEATMDRAAGTADNDARNTLLAAAEKILLDDTLVAPLAGGASWHLVKSRVKGWVDNAVEYHPSRFISVTP
jgi:oligopeptide transport system substrate-binding protein